MAPPPRLFPKDEELGKRDDDHRPGTTGLRGAVWQKRQLPHGPYRRTVKRAAVIVLALVALFYFFKNMPTDLKNPTPRPSYDHSGVRYPPTSQKSIVTDGDEGGTQTSSHHFNGPIKFYNLAVSLREALKAMGTGKINKNVVCLYDSFPNSVN
jgi:hypothetical protein